MGTANARQKINAREGIFIWNPDDQKNDRILLYQSNNIISPLSINVVHNTIEVTFVDEVQESGVELLRDESGQQKVEVKKCR